MVTNISYNVIIDRLKAFATGHFLIKHFSHGQIDLRYLEKDADYYPWMHVIPGTINPAEGLREYSFDITFSDLTRDKEHESEYIREAISDCTRLAEDLLAEIKNGNTLFDSSVQIVDGSSITPFIHEDTHTLTGVTLSLSIRVPWDWSACDIPADYAPGGSGSGGGAFGGCCVTLQVGGVDSIDQTLLNLIEGTNMTITDNGDGSVTFDSTGGIASISWGQILGTLSDQTDLQNALDLKADISSLATVATTGDYNDLLNLPSLSGFVPYTGATNDVAIGNHNITADDGSFNSAMQPSLFGVENAAATEYATLEYNALSVVNSNTGDTTQITSTGITFPDATTQSTAAVPQVNSDWNAVTGVAEILNKPTSLPPSGNAGGDLQQTYPNPTVHRIHGVDMQSGTPSTDDVWVYGGLPAKWRHQQLGADQVNNTSSVTGTSVKDALDHLNTTKVETTRSISTTSPLSGGGDLSANRTLSIAQANTSTNGYLSSTDWNTFNGKQNSVGFTTVGNNIATLANPSAITYLKIAADNTVSAITAAQLKTDLGIPSGTTFQLVTTSDQASNSTAAIVVSDITGLTFPITSGKRYKFKALLLHTASTTLVSVRVGVGANVAVASVNQQICIVTAPAGTVIENRYNLNTLGLPTYSNTVQTTQWMSTVEGILIANNNGTAAIQFSKGAANAGTLTIKAGSILEYFEI